MERIYETIKVLRKKNHLTQQDLAECLNLETSSISKYENGETDISLMKLELLSKKFNMSVLELLAYPDEVIVNKQQSEKIKNVKQKAEELLKMVNDL